VAVAQLWMLLSSFEKHSHRKLTTLLSETLVRSSLPASTQLFHDLIRRLAAAQLSNRFSSASCLPISVSPRHSPRLLAAAASGLISQGLLHHHNQQHAAAPQPSAYTNAPLRLSRNRLPFSTASSTAALHVMDASFDSRSKRKHPASSASDRPKKQLRSEVDTSPTTSTNGVDLTMASSQLNGDSNGDMNGGLSHDLEDSKMLSRVQTAAETAEWQETIETVVKKVVAIHMCLTASFDTESALTSEATGFVVDAERGYILTNRVSRL